MKTIGEQFRPQQLEDMLSRLRRDMTALSDAQAVLTARWQAGRMEFQRYNAAMAELFYVSADIANEVEHATILGRAIRPS